MWKNGYIPKFRYLNMYIFDGSFSEINFCFHANMIRLVIKCLHFDRSINPLSRYLFFSCSIMRGFILHIVIIYTHIYYIYDFFSSKPNEKPYKTTKYYIIFYFILLLLLKLQYYFFSLAPLFRNSDGLT